MNTKKRVVALGLLILLLLAGFALWQHRPVPSAIHLKLTGTTGLKVAGTVTVDGVNREFSGILPTNIDATARRFEYTLWMQEPRGELRGELTVSDGVYGSSSAANDSSGVRGSYSHDWFSRGGMWTTVRKGE